MKPPPFDYHAPGTVDEAIALLREHGDEAKVLAGGQSLIPLLALRLARPAHLVDIAGVAGLGTLAANGVLTVGATVTQRAAEHAAEVASLAPLLARALPAIAHPQIRNRGTVCGSIAHADPAAELPAVALALDAEMVAAGPGGRRTIAAADFFRSYLETALAADELLVEVRFPPVAGARVATSFLEISRRHGDFALAGVATVIATDAGGTVRDARLSFLGLAPTPVRVPAAERALVGSTLVGSTLDGEAVAAAAELVRLGVEPADDVHASAAYRRHVAAVLARRSLDAAAREVAAR